MLRDFIIGIFPIAMVTLIGLLILIKIVVLVLAEVKQNKTSILMRSFLPYSNQAIRNTFNKQLEDYYRISNKINYFFYTAASSVAGVYLLMVLL